MVQDNCMVLMKIIGTSFKKMKKASMLAYQRTLRLKAWHHFDMGSYIYSPLLVFYQWLWNTIKWELTLVWEWKHC